MSASSDKLHLFLARDDQQSTPLNSLPADAANRAPSPPQRPRPKSMSGQSDPPDDLAKQRWGVIVPAGKLGEQLLLAVRPLIEARQQQQGDSVVILTVPSGTMNLEAAGKWRQEYYEQTSLPPEQRRSVRKNPYYLLILGDLHQVPCAIHQVLGHDCLVGRLAFTDENGEPELAKYEAYVHKVLRWEKTPTPATRARAAMRVVRDYSDATEAALYSLIQPAILGTELARREDDFPALAPLTATPPTLADASELLRIGAAAEPTALLTVSHGLGAPRAGWAADARQRQRQGAMCLADGQRLFGEDFRTLSQPFLPGGFWFMFACFGAGTPLESEFAHWLQELRKNSLYDESIDAVLSSLPKARPFIAALPQAVLAAENGPLAFMGHLDLAWTYSFQDLATDIPVAQPGRFVELMKSLVNRHRVGVAMNELLRQLAASNFRLSMLYNQAKQQGVAAESPELGQLWMARQDMLGYVLLGDPAVRLPMQDPAVASLQPEAESTPVSSLPQTAKPEVSGQAVPAGNAVVTEAPGRSFATSADPSLDQVEEAIWQLVIGEQGSASIATKCGIDRRELQRLAAAYSAAGRKFSDRDTPACPDRHPSAFPQ